MAQLNIRIDDDLKSKAEILFDDLGLNISTAVNMFIRQAVRQGSIPFEITTQTNLFTDPFWNEANQAHLRKVIAEYESGKSERIYKTLQELQKLEESEEMEDE